MSSSNSGRHALLRALQELWFETSHRLPLRLRCKRYAVEPMENRTPLSAVTPESCTSMSLAFSALAAFVCCKWRFQLIHMFSLRSSIGNAMRYKMDSMKLRSR